MPSRKENQGSRMPPRGWAGRNPEGYHSFNAAMSFMANLIGSVIAGQFLASWLERPWILGVAIAWGFGGGLWILIARLNEIERRYGGGHKKEKTEDPPGDS